MRATPDLSPEDLLWSLALLGAALLRQGEKPLKLEETHEKAPVHP